MISRLDRDVGRLLARLKERGIDNNTLVLFSSDNGPHHEGNNNPDLFRPGGPLRGMKRSLYEGGIRVPLLARWPGRIKRGTLSNHVGYFGDFFATVCEFTGQKLPAGSRFHQLPAGTAPWNCKAGKARFPLLGIL